jgi:hypothetical protein
VLAQGAALPVAQMTPAQRALLLAQTRAPSPNHVLWGMTAPPPAEGLAVKSEDPSIIRRERHGGLTTFYREDDHPLVRMTASRPDGRGAESSKNVSEEPVMRYRIRPITFWVVSGSMKWPLFSLDVLAEP